MKKIIITVLSLLSLSSFAADQSDEKLVNQLFDTSFMVEKKMSELSLLGFSEKSRDVILVKHVCGFSNCDKTFLILQVVSNHQGDLVAIGASVEIPSMGDPTLKLVDLD